MVNFKESESQQGSTIKLDLSSQLKQQFKSEEWGFHTFLALGIKLVIVSTAPLGLFFYEKYNKNILLNQKAQVEAELTARKQKLQQITKELAAYDGAHKKNKEFQNKMNILKNLADDRIMVIRALDKVQEAMGRASEQEDNINEFMFFNAVSIRGNKLAITGSASKEGVIDQFVEKLQREDTVYHSINWEDVVSNQQTKIKNFRVTGEIISNKGT